MAKKAPSYAFSRRIQVIQPDKAIAGKWDLRQCVDYVAIDPETWVIEVQASPETDTQWENVKRAVDHCNKRLSSSKRFLRATSEIGLYYQVVDLLARPGRAEAGAETLNKTNTETPEWGNYQLPSNAAGAVFSPDPDSQRDYSEIVAPCLKEAGFYPVQIEDVPPEGPYVERLQKVLMQCHCVLFDITDDASHLVHFRLGTAVGLRRRVLLYSRRGTDTVGDLSGTEVLHYQTQEQLRKDLRIALGHGLAETSGRTSPPISA